MTKKREPLRFEVGFGMLAPTWKQSSRRGGLHAMLARLHAGWTLPGLSLEVNLVDRYDPSDSDRLCGSCISEHMRAALIEGAKIVRPDLIKVLKDRSFLDAARYLRGNFNGGVRVGWGRYHRFSGRVQLFRGNETQIDLQNSVMASDATVKALRRFGYGVVLLTDDGNEYAGPTKRWKVSPTCTLHTPSMEAWQRRRKGRR